MWARAEYKFFWNENLSQELIAANANDWILPVVNGYIQIENTQFDGHDLEYVLISRRDHRHIGTRFCVRGLNQDGHAVNFVETEQILVHNFNNKITMSSYIQTRGSIPLLWQQRCDLSYMPKGKIVGSAEQNSSASQLHFHELLEVYGDQVFINLVDAKGNQKELGMAFKDIVDSVKMERLKYIWFDFHAECKKM
jgi:hypothetical protein